MSAISFYLKKSTKKGESVIMLCYQNKGQKFRYSTKMKIDPKNWKGQKVKNQCSDADEINSLLLSYAAAIREIEREALFFKKDYSIDVIKRKFESKIGCLSTENDFFKSYDRFIEQSKPCKSITTVKAYVGTKNKLIEYQLKKREEISFETINSSFYEKFVDYLITDGKYLNNTIGKHIKTLKTFLNYAKEHEFTNATLNLKKFKVIQEEVDIIYLTDSELMKLAGFSGLSETLSNVRDCFCFSCFTGLRFSDLSKLTKQNIKNDYLEIRTEKTKELLKIPLNDFAMEILEKHRGRKDNRPLPAGISNQKTNDYLKEIGEKVGINEIVETENFSGSNKVQTSKYKYELITTHSARRTFVTLALEKGMRAEVVMSMTGHKSYRTFKKYIKITDKVMQNDMKRLWSRPLLKVV